MRNTTLGQVVDETEGSLKTGPFGTKLKASEYAPIGAPVISVGEVGYGELRVGAKTKRVPSAVIDRMPEYLLQPGDIVFGRKGAVDRSAWVRAGESGYFLGSDGIRVRFGAGVHSRFMAYQLQSVRVRAWLLQHAVGTTLASLNEPTLRSVPVAMPSLDEQRAIAVTLGAFDDKIESNRRAAITISGLVAAKFSTLVSQKDSTLMPLGELTEVVKGRSYKSVELSESRTALVTLKSVDRSGGYKDDGLKPYTGAHKPNQIVRPGEIVVAQTDLTQGAEVVGRGVRVPGSADYDTLVASLDLAIVRPKDEMPIEYLLGLLTSEDFRQWCRSRVTGTTVLHLAKDAIPSWPAPMVSFEQQRKFAEEARALYNRLDSLNEESRRLATLRDALLPELLSGRVRTREAQGV